MAKDKEKLMIIDGNALIHRSFHALPPTITTKTGEMVNAVYGFASFFIKAMREIRPEYVVLTLDKKGPTFRHKKFKEYKAKRIKAPQELYDQIPKVKEIVRSFNIPVFAVTGFEADDLIGTISRKVDGNVEKIILTGDMDTLQLVNHHTKVYTMSRGITDSIIYDEKAVRERYDLKVEQLIDYKALRGDPSDNIPGVRGIGEKTAVELLKNFKTLDGVYKNLDSDKTKDRIKELLNKHKKDAFLSKELGTIKCDVPIKFDLEATRFKDLDKNRVIKVFSEFEFKSLLPRVQALFNNLTKETKEERRENIINKFERNKTKFKYKLIEKEKDFNNFLALLKKQKQFTFDTETSSFDPLTADLLGISFSWKPGEAYYVKVKSEKLKVESKQDDLFSYRKNKKIKKQENKKTKKQENNFWLQSLKPVFEDEKVKKIAQNAKFDIRVMKNNGIDVKGLYFDTMLASYLLSPGTRGHGLDALAFSEFGFEKISKDDLLGKGRDRITFSEIENEKLGLYSCEDADFTNRLVKKLKPRLKEHELLILFNKIEVPLVLVLARMEDRGVKINKQILAKMSEKIAKKINSLEKKIFKEAGGKFNIKSTQQLKEVLFEKLEIPIDNIKKTKTGLSTAAGELEKLKDMHPIIRLIQEYRELTKLASTYINALPLLINKKTNRLHTSFNQTITATGRLSSTEPNLQNIPIRTELGREIRQAFVSEKGCKLLSLDYSQIELRLAAHMSSDKKMMAAFRNNIDIHRATAAEINQVNPGEVTSEMRREAKAINFGLLYGQGAHGLAQTADISYFKAKEFIDEYFKVYKGVKKYIDASIQEARKKGYAETLLHRRRYLPDLNSSVVMVRKAAERMAINTPLQGTAADMIKVAMIEVEEKIKDLDIKMILQVHDELVFEVKNDKLKKAAKKIKDIMEGVIKLKVPIVVDVSAGNNWGEMIKLKV